MILYVNGDSHSAGAKAVNSYSFAMDDPLYYGLGRRPHPDNERASYGCDIANRMYAILHCDAESASSNSRILRTTKEYLAADTPDFLIIGWSTWEREEWLHEGQYYQVTASGTDTVPAGLKERYMSWVIEVNDPDRINKNIVDAHEQIVNLHTDLTDRNIPHIFFNTYTSFQNVKNLKHLGVEEIEWNGCYVDPYNDQGTYYSWLKNKNFNTVDTDYHYAADAHRAWAEYLYNDFILKRG